MFYITETRLSEYLLSDSQAARHGTQDSCAKGLSCDATVYLTAARFLRRGAGILKAKHNDACALGCVWLFGQANGFGRCVSVAARALRLHMTPVDAAGIRLFAPRSFVYGKTAFALGRRVDADEYVL